MAEMDGSSRVQSPPPAIAGTPDAVQNGGKAACAASQSSVTPGISVTPAELTLFARMFYATPSTFARASDCSPDEIVSAWELGQGGAPSQGAGPATAKTAAPPKTSAAPAQKTIVPPTSSFDYAGFLQGSTLENYLNEQLAVDGAFVTDKTLDVASVKQVGDMSKVLANLISNATGMQVLYIDLVSDQALLDRLLSGDTSAADELLGKVVAAKTIGKENDLSVVRDKLGAYVDMLRTVEGHGIKIKVFNGDEVRALKSRATKLVPKAGSRWATYIILARAAKESADAGGDGLPKFVPSPTGRDPTGRGLGPNGVKLVESDKVVFDARVKEDKSATSPRPATPAKSATPHKSAPPPKPKTPPAKTGGQIPI
jgi:hypothetical protein